ncbi:hypothetical protein N431DRAFT_443165 [Stipitochalara longipes BDJ]|nr:hypothetical protein N431DRAFT_443165 [Stipitochalara longipes BDJ]
MAGRAFAIPFPRISADLRLELELSSTLEGQGQVLQIRQVLGRPRDQTKIVGATVPDVGGSSTCLSPCIGLALVPPWLHAPQGGTQPIARSSHLISSPGEHPEFRPGVSQQQERTPCPGYTFIGCLIRPRTIIFLVSAEPAIHRSWKCSSDRPG